MPDTTARLGLPVIAPSQAQKHVTHNEALRLLDGITQLVLTEEGLNTPPALPDEGALYGLGVAPNVAWAGEAGKLAQWQDGHWLFLSPQEGWRAWDIAANVLIVYRSGAWVAFGDMLQNLSGVGIGATSDATNRLSVTSEATLLNHAGAGHQLKLNKAGAGDTTSLLYQSNWAGHAEMGLTGDNDFHLRVSPDGSNWTEALVVDAVEGTVSGAGVQASASDTAAGRLARADYVYGPGNLLGSASESGGLPTGAVVERGANANGAYVRFADGTQICTTSTLTWAASSSAELVCNVTFPAAFAIGSDVTFAAGLLDPRADTDITFDFDMTAASTVFSRYMPDYANDRYYLRVRALPGTYVAGTSRTRVLATFTGRWF